MFLFTTPQNSESSPAPSTRGVPRLVQQALQSGAQRTGVDYAYLQQTAQRESGFRVDAQASSSSAQGLFQFTRDTWLGLMHNVGASLGLSHYANAIEKGSDGRYRVSSPELSEKILDLRNDPQIASVMAGHLTQNNARVLQETLQRAPTSGELYAAHFMGGQGAARLLKEVQTNPIAPAAALFPEAARANRSIFYDTSGNARSVAQLAQVLTSKHGSQTPVQSDPSLPLLTGVSFDSLFLNGRPATKTNRPLAIAPTVVASVATPSVARVPYFPSSKPLVEAPHTAPAPETPPVYPLVQVPLPVARPS
jgi:hypothetical protein